MDAPLNVANGTASFTLGLSTPNQWDTRLVALADGPANGQLTSPATFNINFGTGSPVPIVVPVDNSNQTLDDLVADINQAISITRLVGDVRAIRQNNKTGLVCDGLYGLSVTSTPGNSADTQLHLHGASAAPAIHANLNSVFQQRLAPIQNFSMDDFVDSVRKILALFEEQKLPHLTTDLPLVKQSLDEILDVSQKLNSAIVNLDAKAGLALKAAVQGIVNNLKTAIIALPSSVTNAQKANLNAIYNRLRIAAQNAGRSDVAAPVDLGSVVIASLAPYTAAVTQLLNSTSGLDPTNLNSVANQLQAVTPSLLQLGSEFSAALGVGSTSIQFSNANKLGFEQALEIRTDWAGSMSTALPLLSTNIPGNFGPLTFAPAVLWSLTRNAISSSTSASTLPPTAHSCWTRAALARKPALHQRSIVLGQDRGHGSHCRLAQRTDSNSIENELQCYARSAECNVEPDAQSQRHW